MAPRLLSAAAVVAAAATAAAAAAPAAPLYALSPDVAVVADATQPLTGPAGPSWTAANTLGLRVAATVPGDIVTDLQRAGVIGDPWFELGFLNSTTPGHQGSPLWDATNWTLSTTFSLSQDTYDALTAGASFVLNVDGCKMAADFALNGAYLGFANDQFLRFSFPVSPANLLSGANTLEVTLARAADARNDEGRFMGATNGWDWGPYVNAAQLQHASPRVFYRGAYPTAPLVSAAEVGPWLVSVKVQMLAGPGGATGTLALAGAWPGGVGAPPTPVSVPEGVSTVVVNMTVPVGAVELWWPNGLGEHALYELNTTFAPNGGGAPLTASRRVGFRVFVLVTGDDSDPAALAGVDGSGNLTMRFRVNGANVWARGADIVPMEVIEGRQSDVAYRGLIASAAAAHFNTLRVNGIDLFFPDIFYTACDEAGIMIYQDMSYSVASPGPSETPLQRAEMLHSLRRVSHHPSVVVYDGNNEMGSGGIWEYFVMQTVADEDPSRSPWPASPSNGWGSGVDRLWSTPNGGAVHAGNFDMRQLEGHGPYQHGNGWPTVDDNHAGLDPMWPPGLNDPQQPNTTAATLPGFFASEFGCVAPCSFESLSAVLAPQHWALHGGAPPDNCSVPNGYWWNCTSSLTGMPGNAMAQHNYASDSMLDLFFGAMPEGFLDRVGAAALQQQLYLAMLAQQLQMSGQVWQWRSGPANWGTLYWDVNDIWPTTGWGTLEYGTYDAALTQNQVVGGRWKPAHHALEQSLFRDVIAACGAEGRCFARNDDPLHGLDATLTTTAVRLADGAPLAVLAVTVVSLPPGGGAMTWTCMGNHSAPGAAAAAAAAVAAAAAAANAAADDVATCTMNLTASVDVDGPVLCPAYPGGLKTATLGDCCLASQSQNGSCPSFVYITSSQECYLLVKFSGEHASDSDHTTGHIGPFPPPPPPPPPPPGPFCDGPGAALLSAGCAANGSDCGVLVALDDATTGAPLSRTFFMQSLPRGLALNRAVTVAASIGALAPDGASVPVSLTVSGGAALYVVLTTLAQGRFVDNAWPLLAPGTTTTAFVPIVPASHGGPPINVTLLAASLRIDHLAMHQY